jgi:hypothetical protein
MKINAGNTINLLSHVYLLDSWRSCPDSEHFLIFEGEAFISLKKVVAFHSARIILSAGLAVRFYKEGDRE